MTEPFDMVLIACRPVVITDAYPRNLPVPDPHEGSIEFPCDHCDCAVYLGPAQQQKVLEVARAGGDTLVLCFLCTAIMAKQFAEGGDEVTVAGLTDKTTPLRMPPDPRRDN